MTPEMLARIAAAQTQARGVALLTRLTDGAQALWPDDAVAPALAEAAEAALRDDMTANVTLDDAPWFIHPHTPALRLIVVGAVHRAQSLAPMAAAAGFAVTIVDPRGAFASAERFPGGVALNHDWPDDAMRTLAPDRRTAVVTLTHDPKLDDPALDAALGSPAFYIGALGSRRTHAKRLGRLGELGHGSEATARIHAPVGLDIGAVTAPEIALSILAEIVAVRRGPRRAAKAAA